MKLRTDQARLFQNGNIYMSNTGTTATTDQYCLKKNDDGDKWLMTICFNDLKVDVQNVFRYNLFAIRNRNKFLVNFE